MKKVLFVLVISSCLLSCTKSPVSSTSSHAPVPPDMIAAYSPNPDALILEATIDVPKALSKKVGTLDTMFWALTSEDGKRIAHGMIKVDKLPKTITVLAKNLLQPVKKNASLELSVHLAKPGSEFKPVEKGWLVASSANLKMSAKAVKSLAIGDKITLQLETMSF